MGIFQLVTYGAVAVFFLAVLSRLIKNSRLPLHLRWELYPVAHEAGRASYGGSYLEEYDWWTKPRHSSKVGEAKVMLPEILLLSGVWHNNKSLWFKSFPFHFGLYLLGGLLGLLLVGGIATAAGAGVSAAAGFPWILLHYVTVVLGYAGMGLALAGSLGLLGTRLFDEDYREYTKMADYFNLVFFVAVLGVALAAQLVADPAFEGMRAYFAGLVTFDLSFSFEGFTWKAGLTGAEIVLASLLLAYIPLTHMSHFFAKLFMYHGIRWNDEPNLRGGKMEKEIAGMLELPVSWSADHIRGDGKKNWVDVATSPAEDKKE